MKFLCLAYGDGRDWEALTEGQRAELLEQDEKLRARGDLVCALAEPTTVAAWDGPVVTKRGPFGHADRPLVGFAVIEARDIDEAVGLVAHTPCAVAKGAIEVWPVRKLG